MVGVCKSARLNTPENQATGQSLASSAVRSRNIVAAEGILRAQRKKCCQLSFTWSHERCRSRHMPSPVSLARPVLFGGGWDISWIDLLRMVGPNRHGAEPGSRCKSWRRPQRGRDVRLIRLICKRSPALGGEWLRSLCLCCLAGCNLAVDLLSTCYAGLCGERQQTATGFPELTPSASPACGSVLNRSL